MKFSRLPLFGLLSACVLSSLRAQTIFTHDADGNRTAQAVATAPTAPTVVTAPLDQISRIGGTARFVVLAGGTGPFSYQWFAGGSPITGATADTLVLTNVTTGQFTPAPGGTPRYTVQVTNSAGSITSAPAALYRDSTGNGLADWWQQQYFGNLNVEPNLDADGDGVSNAQEQGDRTDPTSAGSRLGRLSLLGPTWLVNAFPASDTYAAGTPVSVRGASFGELQFGGWTGSLRSPASDFTFDFSAGGDHALSGLFGALPVEETAAPPFFARTIAAAASIQNFATAADGSVIVCGTFDRLNDLPRRFVARLFPNGLPDPNFAPVVNGPVTAAAVQADGKVILVGSFTQVNGTARPGVARVLANGALDPAFAPASQGANVSQISHLAVQRDGKILVAGSIWNGAAFQPLARFQPGGALDTAFGPTVNGAPSALAIQRDGKILLGGAFTQVNGTDVSKLVRLLTDGTLDPAFSAATTTGVATPPVAIIVQPDGRILAGGAVQMSPHGVLPVIRLLANGTLDTAFTGRITALTPTPTFRALALQDDGRIVGVGSFTLTKPDVVNAVRLKADGSVDADAFVISRANGPINAVAAQTDRGLVLGGDFVTMTPREGPMNDHRYVLTAGRKTWTAAEAEAQGIGGHLFAINGQAEQNFAQLTLLPTMGFFNETSWLGISDRGVEGLFAWATGEPMIFTNWNSGEPNNAYGNNGGEDAGEMHGLSNYPVGRWNDLPETLLRNGIIELDPAAPVEPTTAWVAGRDLARNERSGAVTELTNPNATVPEWSYGGRATQLSATRELTAFASMAHVNGGQFEGWQDVETRGVVVVNPSNAGQFDASAVYRPGEMLLHPAPTGFTVIRWTCPSAGTYAVSAFWQDGSWGGGDGCNASVIRNGDNVLFSADFDNVHGTSMAQVATLAQGDIIEFTLGSRGGYFADATRFDAIIKRVPDAAAVWVAGRDLVANEKPDGGAQETQNPNPTVPAWSYGGRSAIVSSGLTLFPPAHHINSGGGGDDALEGWSTGAYAVAANTGTAPISYNYGFGPNLPFYPGEMLLAPAGGGGPFPVARWTAPAAGTYDIFAWWQDSDFHGGNGFSAHLVVNGGQVYGQDIDNAHGASTFQTLTLAAGDQVDFTMGARGAYDFDTTKFNAVILGAGSPVAPPVTVLTPVTTRAALGGNATIDWATAAPNYVGLPNPFGVSASNGAAFRVSKASDGGFERLAQGNGWFGNFTPGDPLLNHVNTDGPVVITAAERGGVFSALGAQIMPNQNGAFVATLRAFDVHGTLLGSFNFNGTSNDLGDNSAIFVGVRSDSENIHSVSIDTNTTGFGGDFALNHVSIVSTPSANGDLALSRGGLARVVTTNLLTTGELGVSPTGPIFATGASVNMLLAPQTSDAPILTVRLERSGDGHVFQDAGVLTPAGSGMWSANPVLPPGTSHYRAVVTDGRQQQRRSFAAGPFVTPPAVTSELVANGQVGLEFQYVASGTGPLSGFTATGLPAWATATYDPTSELLTITGTPTAAGPSAITLTPANAAGATPATLALMVSHTFESWRMAQFTAAELNDPMLSGPNGDATGGGIDNLLRYALGIPAKRVGMAGLPVSSMQTINGQKFLTLTYTRDLAAAGVTLTVQITENLAAGSWNSGTGYTTEVSRVDNGDGTETVVTRDNFPTSTSPSHRFIRLRVSQ